MMPAFRDGTGEELKAVHNILACLEYEGPLSRAAIAKRLSLSRTTLSNLMTRLVDQRLVVEMESADPQGRGRPGIPVDLDTSSWFALGAAFHARRWLVAVTNLKGGVVRAETFEPCSTRPEDVVETLVRAIRTLWEQYPGALLPGVGIGVPGLVNRETGTIIRADDLGWRDVGIGRAVREQLGLTPYVINRNRAAGMAEARYGRGRQADSFIYIGIGTGISAAIMIGGEPWHGSSFSAGEIGHIVVDPAGPLCGCGRHGCLQMMAAENAMLRAVERLSGHGLLPAGGVLDHAVSAGEAVNGELIGAAFAAGDAAAVAVVREAASRLGMVVGNLINAFNPEKIILGGPLTGAIPQLVEEVRLETERWAMRHPFASVSIEPSLLDEYVGAQGAACLVLRNKLELSAPA